MGIGFICTIAGVIAAGVEWKYAYLFPYSHPMLVLKSIKPPKPGGKVIPAQLIIDFFAKDVYVSLIVFAVVFVAGFFIVQRKSIK